MSCSYKEYLYDPAKASQCPYQQNIIKTNCENQCFKNDALFSSLDLSKQTKILRKEEQIINQNILDTVNKLKSFIDEKSHKLTTELKEKFNQAKELMKVSNIRNLKEILPTFVPFEKRITRCKESIELLLSFYPQQINEKTYFEIADELRSMRKSVHFLIRSKNDLLAEIESLKDKFHNEIEIKDHLIQSLQCSLVALEDTKTSELDLLRKELVASNEFFLEQNTILKKKNCKLEKKLDDTYVELLKTKNKCTKLKEKKGKELKVVDAPETSSGDSVRSSDFTNPDNESEHPENLSETLIYARNDIAFQEPSEKEFYYMSVSIMRNLGKYLASCIDTQESSKENAENIKKRILLKSVDLISEIVPSELLSTIKLFIELHCTPLDLGDSENHLEFLERCKVLAEKFFGSYGLELASIYHHLGDAWKTLDCPKKSLEFYKKSELLYSKFLSAQAPDFILAPFKESESIVNHLYIQSKCLHKSCSKILNNINSLASLKLAEIQMKIGQMHYDESDYSTAISFFKKCKNLREKYLPTEHLDLASVYNCLGNCYFNIENYKIALDFYIHCQNIRAKELPSEHLELAESYNHLGNAYYYSEEYTKALEFYNKCKKIREKKLPSNHAELAMIYNNLACTFYYMEEFPQAIEYFEKRVKTIEHCSTYKNLELADAYNSLGSSCYYEEKYEEALECYEKCRKIRETLLPKNDLEIANIYNNLASVWYYKKNYEKAKELYKKCKKIKKIVLSEESLELADVYNYLGNSSIKLKEINKAFKNYKKCKRIRKITLGKNHTDVGLCYYNMANTCAAINNWEKVIQYLEKCKNIYEKNDKVDADTEDVLEKINKVKSKSNKS
ncbi:hypothetical protein SteCoe_32581 [Stentor coeruleus]|uniref:Uncharacterized protein n=1 Tax=Stentor coeruleus TaxID=5963 RepID=A0A1R2AYQ5_9CILI|nr:hypothetical protein SteCoe_32581 [Stentor coeruleus]